MSEPEASSIMAVEPVIAVISDEPSPRRTRSTWLLIGLLIVLFMGTFRLHPRRPVPHNVRYSVRLVDIGVEWGLFFIAYIGIHFSNQQLRDVMGPGWMSDRRISKDLIDAMVIVILIHISTAVFHNIEPFRRSGAVHSITWVNFILAVGLAISAGYCEEVAFRGFLFQQFRLCWNPTVAFLTQALLFAIWHGGNQSATEFLKHFASGCLFGYYALKRKSLWPGILGHALLDTIAEITPFIRVLWHVLH